MEKYLANFFKFKVLNSASNPISIDGTRYLVKTNRSKLTELYLCNCKIIQLILN